MSGDVTIVQLKSTSYNESTILIYSESTILTYTSDITVLSAAPATINLPTSTNLSDSVPAELSLNGSAGVSLLASRSDHSHPMVNLVLNGGNF